MKPRIIPLYFPSKDDDFDQQLTILRELLAGEVEFLSPAPLGAGLPEAEAVLFPQMLGDAYRMAAAFREISIPRLIITSEFATVSMWDWEIRDYLRSEGIETIAPYNLEQTRLVCRALGVKRALKQAKFMVFQDNPGAGFQASIFKRFYWWEDECLQRMKDAFGVTIVKKSFQELGATARAIPDSAAQAAWETWKPRLAVGNLPPRAVHSALKLYLALKRELDADGDIRAMGINCLNESHFSDTTPCLAWNILYEELGLTWGCEADLVSMLTQFILHETLGAPIMMTNLYPFLMGQAALKHEHIPEFPAIENPENHILVAHCGYLGVVPQSFSTEWNLRSKVLAIVDDNATAIDARLPVGAVTLTKLRPTFTQFTAIEGQLVDYVQYPNSHCLNGGVIRVPDGRHLMENLASHHYLLMTGHHSEEIGLVAKVFGLQ
jgi:hypothetical protein